MQPDPKRPLAMPSSCPLAFPNRTPTPFHPTPPSPQFARMRKEYVPLYIEHLRSPIDPSRPHDRLPKGIVDMDRQLPEQTIVMFRQVGICWDAS